MEVNKFLVSGKLGKSFWIESWQIDTWRNERTKVVLLFSLSKRENRFAPQIANFHNSLFHLLPLSSFVFLCLPLFVHASIFSFCHFCYLSSFFFFTYFPIVYCLIWLFQFLKLFIFIIFLVFLSGTEKCLGYNSFGFSVVDRGFMKSISRSLKRVN